MTRASTKPHNSSKWCQSRQLRASLEASKHKTAPTSPAQSQATSRSKPGRAHHAAGGSAQVVVDDFHLGESTAASFLHQIVLASLTLQVGLNLRLRGLAHVDDG